MHISEYGSKAIPFWFGVAIAKGEDSGAVSKSHYVVRWNDHVRGANMQRVLYGKEG